MPVLSAIYDNIVVAQDPSIPKSFDSSTTIAAINAINPADYRGYGAVVQADGNDLIVECDGGCIDVERGVIANSFTTEIVDEMVSKRLVKVEFLRI